MPVTFRQSAKSKRIANKIRFRRRVRKARANLRKRSFPKGKVYNFKRQYEAYLDTSLPDNSNHWYQCGNNAVVKTFAVALDTLPSPTDFKNLFNQYKINYLVVELYPTWKTVNVANTLANNTTYPITNTQLIVTAWRNSAGIALDSSFTQNDYLQVQSKRTFMTNGNRKIQFKMYLNQLVDVYDNDTSVESKALVKPKYLSTTRDDVPHYGINFHIQKVDDTAFNNMDIDFKVRYTVYLSCKEVK